MPDSPHLQLAEEEEAAAEEGEEAEEEEKEAEEEGEEAERPDSDLPEHHPLLWDPVVPCDMVEVDNELIIFSFGRR